MSLKKFSIIFLIIFILSINTVSADDSFSDLQVLVDSTDNVDLSTDFSFQDNDSQGGVEVSNKDIKINGNNHVIDGKNSSKILTFNKCNVHIENLTFTNGYDWDGEFGGALSFFNSNVTLKNCIFTNNCGGDGGAILSWQDSLEILDCTFTSNDGGAISIFNSNGVIDNSMFLNNSGYAVAFDYTYEHDFIISNSVLNDNTAEENLEISSSSENGVYYAYLTTYNNLADHQISLYVDQDSHLPDRFSNLTFINVSYNEFKNRSYKVKPEDTNNNLANKTIRYEVLRDDECIVNSTAITDDVKATIDLQNLSAGSYQLNVYYNNLEDSADINIKTEVYFTMSVADITVGEDLIVLFNISSDVNPHDEYYGDSAGLFTILRYDDEAGEYVWAYDDYFYTKNNNITVSFLSYGSYIIFLDFRGDDHYDSKEINQTFNVYPADYNMTGKKSVIKINDFDKSYREDKRLYINLTDADDNPLANKTISIEINGITYKRTTNATGSTSIAINFDVEGDYYVVVSFEGDDEYLPTTELASISLPITIYCDVYMSKYCRDSRQFLATFLDSDGNYLSEGKATFNINGVMYVRNIDWNGIARLNINLDQGNYTITATNPLTGSMRSCLIEVLPTIVDNHDLVKYYRNASQFTVTLDGVYPYEGETVTFNINGVMYERKTNDDGVAKLNINLQPGEYVITSMYNGCAVSNKITVLPVLTAEDMNMTYLDGSTFNATLVDGTGKPLSNVKITFNINGVFYDRTTDANGTARLNVRLIPGEYIITSTYGTAVTANKITISG
ncbi:hypothetical protein [Methanobrevibacter sp.]|uniref:hypothetical protein n=1 Tax=Methanobrevibacter sp. TaxID=66852 RepID=UPI00388F7694